MTVLREKVLTFNVSDNTGQYKIFKKTFTQQFSQIYFARLQALRPVILKRLNSLEEPLYIGRVLDVQEGSDSFIIGTVYCENINRPNIFEEVENDQICRHVSKSKYINGLPEVYLEDESGRIELDTSQFADYLWVTGTTIGIKGEADSLGKFFVREIIEPGYPSPLKNVDSPKNCSSKFIALISGLNYGEEYLINNSERSQLIELLNGISHSDFGKNITKLIIAGNTMSAPIKISNEYKKKYGNEICRYKTDHLYQIDRDLSNLSKCIEIEIMPGEADLSTVTLPQKPVPKSLFPMLSKIKSVNFTTNPCLIDVGSIKLLGCSGQNIDDIFRHVSTEDRLLIAEKTLSWRNIAPTTPDSLYCYPFYDKDPFILQEAPHVYFIGNQPEYASSFIKTEDGIIRIVLIPSFAETRTIVLLNIEDLSATPFVIEA